MSGVENIGGGDELYPLAINVLPELFPYISESIDGRDDE